MTTRRKFIKQSLLSSALLIPGSSVLAENKLRGRVVESGNKPLFVSTWDHGLAETEIK